MPKKLILFLASISPLAVLADEIERICEESPSFWEDCTSSVHYDISLYTGTIFGKSVETVYAGNSGLYSSQKLSELKWGIRNLYVLGGTLGVGLWEDIFRIHINGWGKVASGHSTMVDRDWDFLHPSILTDISTSTNTQLKNAFLVDAHLAYDFYRFSPWCSDLILGVILGYQYYQFEWAAYGGKFSYNRGKIVGSYPQSEVIIQYQQRFSIPYIGLNVDWIWDRFKINLFGKYTDLASAKDRDFHVERQALFIDRCSYAQFWSAGAFIEWNVWENLELYFKYTFDEFMPSVGSTNHMEDGQVTNTRNTGGISNFFNMYSIGVNLKL